MSAYSSQVPCSSYWNYARGDYALLYEILSYNWSCVYGQLFAYSAVEQLSSAVPEAPNYAIPFTYCTSSKYSHCFSSMLKHYKHKHSCLCHCYMNNKSVVTYATSSHFQEIADNMLKTETNIVGNMFPISKGKKRDLYNWKLITRLLPPRKHWPILLLQLWIQS